MPEVVLIDKELLHDGRVLLALDRDYRRRLLLALQAKEEKEFLGPPTHEPLGIFSPGSPVA